MDTYLTKEEAAKVAHVSMRTITRWITDGLLTKHLTGARYVRVSKDQVLRLAGVREAK